MRRVVWMEVRAVVAARTTLARVLTEVAAAERPGVRILLDPTALTLDVATVGRIAMPLSNVQAEGLVELGRPARFGRGERTLTDRGVRDTWEIPPRLVQVGWYPAFDAALARVRDGLGLASNSGLTAELHSVLVYGPGQFFLPHQDSEKDDSMVATLVVMVPSRHAGGELVLGRGERATTYRASGTKLSLVAFYADTVHEVRPVTSGYRMALTYNLLLDGPALHANDFSSAAVERVSALLGEHLTTRPKDPYGNRQLKAPSRLVYLLDHEYTARGLSWRRLKGTDASRAALLRAGAQAAGCDVAVGLTQIQETWDALEPDDRYSYRHWSDEDDEEPDEDDAGDDGGYGGGGGGGGDPRNYELQELVDSSISLTRWADPDGLWAEDISLHLDDDEVCASTETVKLRPYESQFEGYMGNYGNTMDRWYRRAAVVVWPRARDFELRAEISPARALADVLTRLAAARPADRSDALARAREQALSIAPFWAALVCVDGRAGPLTTALRASTRLDDAGVATMLLSPFRVETLQASHIKALTALSARHGEPWTTTLLTTWFGDPRGPRYTSSEHTPPRERWLTVVPALATKLAAERDAGRALGRHLVDLAWRQLLAEIDAGLAEQAPSRQRTRLAALGEPLAALLHAAVVLEAVELADRLVADLGNRRQEAVLLCAVPALHTAAGLDAAVRGHTAIRRLAEDCTHRILARAARPQRADGDWSITLPEGCACDLCTELRGFLSDPARTSWEWPLAEPRRRHVHDRIDRAELPVRHSTRRQGRPYTLVLTKLPDLFERERDARAQDRSNLERITRMWALP
jgi:hypothetical protein